MSDRKPIKPFLWNNPLVRIVAHKIERRGAHAWNNSRVYKLAENLGCTLPVLCARAGMFRQFNAPKSGLIRLKLDTTAIRSAISKNLWPVAVTLHFERMESHVAVKNGTGILFSTSDEIDLKMLAGTLGNR